MGSKWRKVKMALASNLCVYVPTADADDSPPHSDGFSDVGLLSPAPAGWSVGGSGARPASPSLRLSKSFNRSSKKTCTICLASMKRGEGQAIFTAECSHSFHFQCIASNVKHGNKICPVCRAKWKEVPLQGPTNPGPPLGRTRINPVNWSNDNSVMTLLRPIPPRPNSPRHAAAPIFPTPEPTIFNDDEALDLKFTNRPCLENSNLKRVLVKTYTEVPAVPRFSAADDFTVLIHLKAPASVSGVKSSNTNQGPTFSQVNQTPRAPVDLVTVLDTSDGKSGCIDVGDLYADEERDFLVSVNIPKELTSYETCLLKVRCHYTDPLTKETVNLESVDVVIKRPEILGQEVVSVEVDRQKNRLHAAEAMVQARTAAEEGDLAQAIGTLENCRRVLSETVSAKSGDRLCVALDAELKEMQERMASRHMYEASGRAYILSGLSSHSWQRATARGDSTYGSSLVQAYQTPSMVEMLTRSQASLLGSPSAQRPVRPIWSFASPKPR
ncbi:putative chromatin regulator PHD family [Helianthus annuus]|nr:putative chromatin regulator PHD family [Helianthus annuus]KAJ0487161.1 putative chromatin regulator PHD family [Helianthus annuus]KAJ0661280.1 putative chromatin regulator PHD family [Helianthus annuus]